MILIALLLAGIGAEQWIVPARELAELGSRDAGLQLPAEPYRLLSGRHTGPSGLLLRCEQDSVLCRLHCSPPSGSLEVRAGAENQLLRSVPLSELMSSTERFSNTNPPSCGKPLVLRAGESLYWTHPGEGTVRWVLRVPSARSAEASAPALQRARDLFGAAPALPDGEQAFQYSLSQNDLAGTLTCIDDKRARGPACVSSIVLRVDGPLPEENVKFLFVRMSFDGEETVVAPLLALFRSVELDPRYRARSGRDYALRWKLPYREKFDFMIENLGPPTTHVSGALYVAPWHWDERSLHFAAIWLKAGERRTIEIAGTGAVLGIAPAIATRESFDCLLRLDGQDLLLESGIARLDRPIFQKKLELTLTPQGQTLLLLGLRPGVRAPLRFAAPQDWESLSTIP
jgi:hypothetical protein